jgi:hypothetical protein
MSALSQAKYAPYTLQGVKMSVFDDKKWLTEVFADSGSVFGLAITKKLIAQYPCWCGSPKCRKTLLAKTPKSRKTKDKAKVAEIRKAIKKLKAQLMRLGH